MTSHSGRRFMAVAVTALALGACKKDSQTDQPVVSKEPGAAATTSMSGDSADKHGQALVRVVNAASATNHLVVRSDDAHALPSTDYKQVSPYEPIDQKWATFQIRGGEADAFQPLETNRELLTDGYRYSMVVMRNNDGTGFNTRVIRDDISSDSTHAHLRVIHAAPGIGEVDVVARGGDKLFDGVNFTSEAGYKDVAAWKGTLEFRPEGKNTVLLTAPNVDLKLGHSYTIVLSRNNKGKLEAFEVEDVQSPNGTMK